MTYSRILAIKLADLGDVLLTEPALRSLRTAYPAARIDVLTTPAAGPLLNMIDPELRPLTFDKHLFDSLRTAISPRSSPRLVKFAATLRARDYDAVAIFHHLTTPAGALKFRALARATGAGVIAGLDNGRGSFLTNPAPDLGFGKRHTVEYMLQVARMVGGADVDPAPRLGNWPAPLDGDLSSQPSPYALLFPTTGPFAPGRNWPVESFAGLAALLVSDGVHVQIAGAADAVDTAEAIVQRVPGARNIAGATTLAQMVTLVLQADVVVTGDSFPGHLAAALGTPLVSIFGPSNHHAWAPYGAVPMNSPELGNACIIRNDVPCSPCLYTGYRLGRKDGCTSRICLTGLSVESVSQAVDAVIGKRS